MSGSNRGGSPGSKAKLVRTPVDSRARRDHMSPIAEGSDVTQTAFPANPAEALLAALFRDIWPGEEGIEVVCPEVTAAGILHVAHLLSDMDDVLTLIKRLDQEPRELQRAYYSTALRQDTEEGLGQVVAVVAAHVHVHDTHPALFAKQLPNGVPPPSAVTVSDNIVDALWFLDRPLRHPADWPIVEKINQRLARVFRAPRGEATIEGRVPLPRACDSTTDRSGPVLVREAFRPDLRYDPQAFFAGHGGGPQRKHSASRSATAAGSLDQNPRRSGSRPTASRRKGKVAQP